MGRPLLSTPVDSNAQSKQIYENLIDSIKKDDSLSQDKSLLNRIGDKIKDTVSGGSNVRLPTERAGTVMVFRTFDRVSYALIMDASKTIHLFDQVTNP